MSGLSVFHFTDKAAYTTNKIWQWQASSTSYINAQAGSEEATRTKIERKGGGYGSERQKRLIVKSQSRPNKRKKKEKNEILRGMTPKTVAEPDKLDIAEATNSKVEDVGRRRKGGDEVVKKLGKKESSIVDGEAMGARRGNTEWMVTVEAKNKSPKRQKADLPQARNLGKKGKQTRRRKRRISSNNQSG